MARWYVFPQWFLVVMMFVAVNRELFSALGVAVLLGVVVGRFALVAWGSITLVIVTSVIVFRFSATLSGRGAIFFGVLCIVASIGFQIGTLSLLAGARPRWARQPCDGTLSDRFRDGACCGVEPVFLLNRKALDQQSGRASNGFNLRQ